jgi:hypothetical protein
MSNYHLVGACFAVCVATTYAHLSAICTATRADKAGEIDFYFGTYHGYQPKTPPGTVTISQPDVAGNVPLSGTFSTKYNAGSTIKIGTPNALKENLIKVTGGSVTKESLVDCYVQNAKSAAMAAPPDGQWIVPNDHDSTHKSRCAGGQYENIGFWSKLTIKNAKSGNWKLVVTGTDQVYDPGSNQCSLSKQNPKWIGGMVVADGSPSCKGVPPVSSGIDPASVANCKDLLGGAMCNSWKCKSDKAESSGDIKCQEGEYKVTAYCKPETACAKQADDDINQITSAVSTCQTSIDGMSNGAHCVKEMDKEVDKAKDDAKKADDEAKKAHEEVGNTHVKIVKFEPIPLDSIKGNDCPGLWSTLKAKSNYNDHKNGHEDAKKAKIAADAKKKAADEEVKKMEEAKKDAVLKCQCATQDKHDKAYAACTANANAQKIGWVKSHHLACVEAESVTLDSNHNSNGQCKVPAVPTVKEKAMAFTLPEKACMNLPSELDMDELAEETMEVEVPQVETLPEGKIPKGYHKMADGEIMADDDMMHM